ncbi:hypothetical protein B0F90DRAFT_1757566 [Multifurca ochricompacta]|uniref:Uncharacterized protein n=1 Tax=Multifurca ochricompacta TaxID=376703 RepID=A0AAD4LYC3_9AGAM|nr:hypothetical protein B0F90DRAFT_1757566 [Multifurca ochricompacta]
MVAIRRTPAPPPQTDSDESVSLTTQVTALSKAKASNNSSHSIAQSSPLANGKARESSHDESREDTSRAVEGARSKKSKGGRKTKNSGKKRKDKHANLADVLLRYLLLFFTIYSLSVCPHDAELKSPVCRGLSEYRRLILEPYILPAVNTALSHPSVSPYVDRVKPYANQAIQVARPVVLRSQHEWNHRIVPQWNKVIVPQYRKYILPQYHKHVTPQLERANTVIQPYLSAVEEKYELFLGPHVRLTVDSVNNFQRAAQPYVLIAADRTYSGYQSARPYLRPVWKWIKRTIKQLLIFLRAQRRQFVDPHVAKIWERVKELSRGDAEIVQSPSAQSTSLVPVETFANSPVAQSHSEKRESTTSFTGPPAASSILASPFEVPPVSVASESSHNAGIAEGAAAKVLSTATSSSIVWIPVVTSSASFEESTPSLKASGSSTPTTLQSSSPSSPSDIDLEAFYADIGLDEQPVPEDENAPEQLEELRIKKLAETAEKRRDIMDRHAKWEEKLEKAIKEKKKALRQSLVALRKAAVQDIKANADVQSAIDRLVDNTETFLKGAEASLAKLKKEPQAVDEKVNLWTKVLAKIDTKFVEHLRNTEDVVNGWYTAHLEKEVAEVQLVTEEVRGIADSAQADIGYDYIWLGDVTYHDWQRYHALLGKSNNFTDLANSIQNGSHPSPPIDPVPDAMHDLQLEVQDIISGFETRFRRIKRNGLKAFDTVTGNVMDEGKAGQDGGDSAQSAEASILPVPGGDQLDPDAPVFKEEFPAIGRGRAEVEEALARAEAVQNQGHVQEAVNGVITHETTVVGSDQDDAKTATPPSASPLHVEL